MAGRYALRPQDDGTVLVGELDDRNELVGEPHVSSNETDARHWVDNKGGRVVEPEPEPEPEPDNP